MLRRKLNKYHNKKTIIDGVTFDSKKEADRYRELKLLEKAGEISSLELQTEFTLQPKFTDYLGRKQRAILYRCDFSYLNSDSVLVVEDVKGVRTREYINKSKMLMYQNPEVIFKEL